MNIMAMRDVGTLVVSDEALEFRGKKMDVDISSIKNVTYGKQGRDFINNWIKIEYADGKTGYFADGNMLGWAGIFGGTKKMLSAIQERIKG